MINSLSQWFLVRLWKIYWLFECNLISNMMWNSSLKQDVHLTFFVFFMYCNTKIGCMIQLCYKNTISTSGKMFLMAFHSHFHIVHHMQAAFFWEFILPCPHFTLLKLNHISLLFYLFFSPEFIYVGIKKVTRDSVWKIQLK